MDKIEIKDFHSNITFSTSKYHFKCDECNWHGN